MTQKTFFKHLVLNFLFKFEFWIEHKSSTIQHNFCFFENTSSKKLLNILV